MPESSPRRKQPPRFVERYERERAVALDALLVAAARYGAATSDSARAEALAATRRAKAQYFAARDRTTQVDCAEAGRRVAAWMEQQRHAYGRPGAGWSTERSEGYSAAMHVLHDWIRAVRARADALSASARDGDSDLPAPQPGTNSQSIGSP